MRYLLTAKAKQLYKAILLLKNEDECKRFLGDLLTSGEIKEFSNRWKVAKMLDKKIPYGRIEKETGMSTTTIARISKWLDGRLGGLFGYQLILKRMSQKVQRSQENQR